MMPITLACARDGQRLGGGWVQLHRHSICGWRGHGAGAWMDEGQKPFDLGDVDISRMQPFQGNKHYLFERSKETLGLLYADHFPYRQKATARGVRRTPFHHHLKMVVQ